MVSIDKHMSLIVGVVEIFDFVPTYQLQQIDNRLEYIFSKSAHVLNLDFNKPIPYSFSHPPLFENVKLCNLICT